MKFLDEKLGKDDLGDSLEKFEDFEDFRREEGQSVNDYISRFDQKYNRILKKNMKLPSEILAFKLWRRANITKEKMLVLTGMDYGQKDTLFEQAKKSIKKFKGEQASGGENYGNGMRRAIKLEFAFLADNEEALLAAGYVHRSRTGAFPRGSRNRQGSA